MAGTREDRQIDGGGNESRTLGFMGAQRAYCTGRACTCRDRSGRGRKCCRSSCCSQGGTRLVAAFFTVPASQAVMRAKMSSISISSPSTISAKSSNTARTRSSPRSVPMSLPRFSILPSFRTRADMDSNRAAWWWSHSCVAAFASISARASSSCSSASMGFEKSNSRGTAVSLQMTWAWGRRFRACACSGQC